MSRTTRYLGHIEISPPLNQAEYDHLRAVRRGDAPLVAEGSVEPWCPWEPCEHGCCLRWSGDHCRDTGGDGLQLLIDHFHSPDTPVGFDDSHLDGFTFDHDTNGVIVGEDGDTRRLFLLEVDHGMVESETLLHGDPMAWEADVDELPWLAPGLSPDERRRLCNEEVLAKLRSVPTGDAG